MMRVTGNNKQ